MVGLWRGLIESMASREASLWVLRATVANGGQPDDTSCDLPLAFWNDTLQAVNASPATEGGRLLCVAAPSGDN